MFQAYQHRNDPRLKEALTAAVQFCKDMASADKPARWITFLGQSGTGKTMLVRAINRFVRTQMEFKIDENRSVPHPDGGWREKWLRKGAFLSWEECINRMINGEYKWIPDASSYWFTALDDIGAEYSRHRDLSAAKLYSILNAREHRWTAITANLDMDGISRLDTRIASRLLRHGSVVIDLTGVPDYNEREP